jgi:beta-phosphoglucomutase-like phosphatase (HAD superfamily)
MGVDPASCTVYEDTDIGLEAARRAGMTAVDVRPLIRDAA